MHCTVMGVRPERDQETVSWGATGHRPDIARVQDWSESRVQIVQGTIGDLDRLMFTLPP